MARKSRVRKTRSRSKPRHPPFVPTQPSSSQAAEVTTVAWMLSMVSALVSEVLGILIRLLNVQIGPSRRLELLSGVLLLVAFLTGLATLVLTPITLRVRSVAPPRVIVISAVVIGAIPLATVLLLVWR